MTAQDSKSSRDWIAKQLDPKMLDALRDGMPATGLWSLLLDVADARAKRRTASELRRQWEADRFVAPASVDQRTQIEIDRHLFAVAREFEAIELSPIAPLGVCSAVALTGQNRIVSTTRGTEVVSDPTNVLAFESARRLQIDPRATVRLATSHRCVRAQPLPKGPGFTAHFRLFCLTSAGHEIKDHAFVTNALTEHMRFHLDAFDRLNANGYCLRDPIVKLLATPDREHLLERIHVEFPGVAIEKQLLTQRYYHGLRFSINAHNALGEELMLSDGGAFDWLEKLCSNRKLALVASAVGSQRIAAVCSASQTR